MKTSRPVSIFITILVLAAFVIYFTLNTSKFRPLAHINWPFLAIILFMNVVAIASNGVFTKLILRPFGKEIRLKESFYVSLISSVGNFFAPVGAGFGFRAVYLKRRHGVAFSDYISTLSGNYIIVFLVSSIFGLFSLFNLRSRSDSRFSLILAAFIFLLAFSIFLSLFRIPGPKPNTKNHYLRYFLENVSRVNQGWRHIVSHKILMLQLIALTTFNLFIVMVINFTIIKSLHFSITLAPLILFSVLGSMSLFINITPANLGVKEAVYLFSSTILGFSTAQILAIALIDRGCVFLVLGSLWVVSNKLKSPLPKRESDEQAQ